jgi:hypothetical protein
MQANQKVGRLTLLERANDGSPKKWLCRCECGKTKTVFESNLAQGFSRSCGCLRLEVKNRAMARTFEGARL